MPTFRFGDFELDVAAYELRRRGRPVRLERRPMDLLILLVERRRQLVTRDDMVQRLWGPGVFVDVETGLNTAIRKVRQALGDAPQKPTFLETVPARGYRFIAEVEVINGAPPEAAQETIIAVLPFENLGSNPEREYLADGLTEETIAALGQIDPGQFFVIGRRSVMAYKKAAKSLAEIGRELGAAYLVESSVQSEGGRVRITSKLIRARDQVQIWSASYDSEPSSMLAFQRELSTAIAEQVRRRLSPERITALARRQTQNRQAYDHYLRGRHYWNQLKPATTRLAVECYARATELDPEYALAWSGIADAYSTSPINGDARPLDVWPRAKEAVAHAVQWEPELAEVQTSVGFLNFFLQWNWTLAEAAFRKAIALDPSYSPAHRLLGTVLSQSARHEEAIAHLRRSRELDPLYAMNHSQSALIAFQAGDYSAAVQHGRNAVVIDPEFWISYFQLAQVYVQTGEVDLALEALGNAGRFSGGNSKVLAFRGYLFAKIGRTQEAREILSTMEALAKNKYVPPYAMALVCAGLEERDDALRWLDRACEARDVHLLFLPVDPKWDPFRNDPRFAAILKRCGFLEKRDQ
jgi:TolB-like protein/Tfp pilus assembly protein PilF